MRLTSLITSLNLYHPQHRPTQHACRRLRRRPRRRRPRRRCPPDVFAHSWLICCLFLHRQKSNKVQYPPRCRRRLRRRHLHLPLRPRSTPRGLASCSPDP